MAQAARLSLRMQRELKLLLSDPPPGAAFPTLSSSSAAPSLSTLDAEIKGPEGSVYANGVFKLKIQIPERYPFHPPVVTFLTPIYHPNIDNGGRICLDILNLPPKGAWQPSLNISSVLTSIGLLLSEPNPDDGLMHDASKEYKYNMQAFYQKARSMTEKFAMPQASKDGASVSHKETQTRSSPRTEKVDDRRSDALSSNGLGVVSRKLSLDPSLEKQHKVGPVTEMNHYNDSTKKVNEITTNDDFEAGGSKQMRSRMEGRNVNPVLYPSDNQIEAENGRGSMDISLKQKQSQEHNNLKHQSGIELCTMPSPSKDLPLLETADRNTNKFTTMKNKRLGLSGRKMNLGSSRPSPSLQENKENIVSSSSFPDSKASLQLGGNLRRQPLQSKVPLQECDENHLHLDREEKLPKNIKEKEIVQLKSDDAMIVLDSEDSEDEKTLSSRSKFSLARRCLPKKQKVKA